VVIHLWCSWLRSEDERGNSTDAKLEFGHSMTLSFAEDVLMLNCGYSATKHCLFDFESLWVWWEGGEGVRADGIVGNYASDAGFAHYTLENCAAAFSLAWPGPKRRPFEKSDRTCS
jgi:hypothetical protein